MRRVTRLPVDTGTSGWTAISTRQQPATPLDGAATADWLIVGAGFAGLAAALRLRDLRPKDRIVVLDARGLAEGPAGRNSGFMIDLPHNLVAGSYHDEAADKSAVEVRLNRHAIAFASRAAERFAMARDTFDPAGKINGAATPRGERANRAFAGTLRAVNEAHELLDAQQMRALTGSSYYVGGLYTPGTVLIQPAAYIRSLAKGICDLGVAIHENSPVTGLERTGSDWAATTPKGRITAPRVIMAVNGHIQNFGFFERKLIHAITYAAMTKPLPADGRTGQPRWAMTPADAMGATVRKIVAKDGERIVARTRYTYEPSLEVSDRKLAGFGAAVRKSLGARFPHLKDIPFEHVWAGRLCLSRNSAPAFGEIEPGLYAACCQNGLGTVKGTLSGTLAAELVCGQSSEELRLFQAMPQPASLPPEPFAALGIRSVIRWQELRAGHER